MSSTRSSTPTRSKADNEMLIKGVTCSLIGLVILVAPYFMGATQMRSIFAQSYLVGWFALILGLAFVVQFLLRRKRAAAQAQASAQAKAAQTPAIKQRKR